MAHSETDARTRSGDDDKDRGFVERFKERGKEQIETQKDAAAEQASRLAHVVERATEELRRGQFGAIAEYAGRLASKINGFADGLRGHRVEDLIDDTRRAAHRNPELFFLGSIAAGVMLSRFFKSSERKQWEHSAANASERRNYHWDDVDPAHNRPSSQTTANILAGGD